MAGGINPFLLDDVGAGAAPMNPFLSFDAPITTSMYQSQSMNAIYGASEPGQNWCGYYPTNQQAEGPPPLTRKMSLGNPFEPGFDEYYAASMAAAVDQTVPQVATQYHVVNGGAPPQALSQQQSLIQCMTGQMESMTANLLERMETAKTPIVSPSQDRAEQGSESLSPSPEPPQEAAVERPAPPRPPPPRPGGHRKASMPGIVELPILVERGRNRSPSLPHTGLEQFVVSSDVDIISPASSVGNPELPSTLLDDLREREREMERGGIDSEVGSPATATAASRPIPIITEQEATPRNSEPDVLSGISGPIDGSGDNEESNPEIPEVHVSGEPEEVPEADPNPSGETPFSEKFNAAWDDDGAFDAFEARFDSVAVEEKERDAFDPFSGGPATETGHGDAVGFGDAFAMDSFIPMEPPPVPQSTPMHGPPQAFVAPEFLPAKEDSFAVAGQDAYFSASDPPARPVNPFLDFDLDGVKETAPVAVDRVESVESPSTPLFEMDTSQPLEEYPRITWEDRRFTMYLRQPNKKKITSQRFWKKIIFHLTQAGVIQFFNSEEDRTPFHELPLQACYAISEICAQQFDQFGKIFTAKLQYVYYKERPGVRPGQVSKAERLTSRLTHFASSAIAGDLAGVKEFGSDLKKLGVPIEHAPQISELMKLGSHSYEEMKLVSCWIDEHLFKIPLLRDRALTYKMEEIQFTTIDEIVVRQTCHGVIERMIARVRVFLLAFLSGMPELEIGINDLIRQGKEVVGRHDIIPVITEEWIRLEAEEFHHCVQVDHYHERKVLKCTPPDATSIELLRFRVRPPRNRELPLQVKTVFNFTGNRVEIHCDILVPGSSGRKMGPVPCEDIAVRIPLPECWIYLFRVEKHFRYGSVKSAHRRVGKVKGLERFLGTVESPGESLMEVTSGHAKYEHHHRAIVWRIARLPKEGQGAYTSHNFISRLNLTSFDQIPENFDKYVHVEFSMPASTVSHCVIRSVSVPGCDPPPEKFVRYVAKHEYQVEIEFTKGSNVNEYLAATRVENKPAEVPKEPEVPLSRPAVAEDSSSSDSD